ncbi:hypothetical protein VCHA50O413_20702 [Vibrio chagasii]|nr:hypothetical protein VCHA34P114_30204 [Vibrio chagasii]CAH7041715.1 hypothetical protein VCHA50O405_10698 [Vibrio chagasii]CAH7129563.1 hypothetical protein VCHA50O402_20706 [Vibrio chagasii]CAH7179398.1 hypothetical protein VCHA50O413_20702 [Vibrio chagasii]CAH7242604.1 hypothetical protein VCHA50O409_40441 [Vibrio chagasii]
MSISGIQSGYAIIQQSANMAEEAAIELKQASEPPQSLKILLNLMMFSKAVISALIKLNPNSPFHSKTKSQNPLLHQTMH